LEHGKAGEALRAIWFRIEALTASVGTVPTRLAFDYLAPLAWASIGAMAPKIDGTWKSLTTQGGHLDSYKTKISTRVDLQVKLGQEDAAWKTSKSHSSNPLVHWLGD
jgi:hypothetical protein